MNIIKLQSILTPLRAACDYGIMGTSVHGEDRDQYIALMMRRLMTACENAGLEVREKETAE